MPSVSFWVTTGIDIIEIQLLMHLIFIINQFNLVYVLQCSFIRSSACPLSGFLFIIDVLELLLRLDWLYYGTYETISFWKDKRLLLNYFCTVASMSLLLINLLPVTFFFHSISYNFFRKWFKKRKIKSKYYSFLCSLDPGIHFSTTVQKATDK